MMWYVEPDAGSHFATQHPVPTDELLRMRLPPSTLVWRDGLENWQPISATAELTAAEPPRVAKPPPPPAKLRLAQASLQRDSSELSALGTARGEGDGGFKRGGPAPAQTGWKAAMTTDGGVYYHNEATDEVSWEKPRSLQTAEEKQASQPHLPPAQQGGQPLTRPSSRPPAPSGGRVGLRVATHGGGLDARLCLRAEQG